MRKPITIPKHGRPLSTPIVRAAFRRLYSGFEPHSCGGFTLDDVLWEAREPFGDIRAAMDELIDANELIFMGYNGFKEEHGCWILRPFDACRIPIREAREEAPF